MVDWFFAMVNLVFRHALLVILIFNVTYAAFLASGCGDGSDATKSCFRQPENCDPASSDCAFFSWKWNGTVFEMELSGGSGDGLTYVAVAFGKMRSMQDADLYFCTGNSLESGVIKDARQQPTKLSVNIEPGISDITAATSNGLAKCTFTRTASVTKNVTTGAKDFDLSTENYYILLARGNMNSGSLTYIGTNRVITENRLNMAVILSDVTTSAASAMQAVGTTPASAGVGEVISTTLTTEPTSASTCKFNEGCFHIAPYILYNATTILLACRKLSCVSQNGRCVTNSIPTAEGTNCQDANRNIERGWCNQGQCVAFVQRPISIDGGWGEWSPWSDCSRTCSGGVSSSFRHCDSPAPAHDGKHCIGQRRRYRSCNTEKCSSGEDFRNQQCSGTNGEPFQGKYYTWVPYKSDHDLNPCVLRCLAQGYSFYTERAPTVVDGTRCFPDSNDMCINGECHHIGCDGVLHSEVVEDKCRVCGGDGSTCEPIKGVFDSAGMQGLYAEIVTIPKGAVHVYIKESVISRQNYLALRSADGKNYVNGGYTIDWPQKFDIAGTSFTYERTADDPEVLKTLGPTTEDLVVMVLLQEPNMGIQYEYNVPIERTTSGDDEIQYIWDLDDWSEYNVPIERTTSGDDEIQYIWDLDDWSECSATCAGGTQRIPVICKRADDGTIVQHIYCNTDTMPTEKVQPCNLVPCEAQWFIGQWQPCSATCGGGERTRAVSCQRKLSASEDEIIDDKLCPSEKSIKRESCNTDVCPPQWDARPWTNCNTECGNGVKKREVVCMSSDGSEKYPNHRCNARHKPPTGARCNAGACPPPRWHTGRWGRCNTQCGPGRQMRKVICLTHQRKRSLQCPVSERPPNMKSCRVECATETPVVDAVCVDDPKFGHCALVRKFNFCKRSYFRKMCCQACST